MPNNTLGNVIVEGNIIYTRPFAVTVTFASFLIEDMFILFNHELNLPDLLFREAYIIIG